MEMVVFTSKDCVPCQKLKPIAEQLAKENQIKLRYVDRENERPEFHKYGIYSVPSIILFKSGVPMQTIIGLANKLTIDSKIKKLKEE